MSSEKYTQFSGRMKIIRERSHLNKKAFAAKLGVSGAYIGQIESGEANDGGTKKPSEMFLGAVCSHFLINPVWLQTGEGRMTCEKHSGEPDEIRDAKSELEEKLARIEAEGNAMKLIALKALLVALDPGNTSSPHETTDEKKANQTMEPPNFSEIKIIFLNLLWSMCTSITVILAIVGMGWLDGPSAWKVLSWLPYLWIPLLVAVPIFPRAAVKVLKHRYVSLVIFKSEKFGEG
jgi:transcriptional regulator with XRE-family HTH domain